MPTEIVAAEGGGSPCEARCANEAKINHECGLFGIWGHEEAAQLSYYGLHSLQHRGQDGAGMVVKNGDVLTRTKGPGLLTEVYNSKMLAEMKGTAAIAHVLYATGGMKSSTAIQPLLFHFEQSSSLAICHNGALVNSKSLRNKLEEYGSIFQTTCSSELLAHIIKRSRLVTFVDSLKRALSQIYGGFAFLLMTKNALYAARDPRGLRPLVLGKRGDAYVVASETCALDTVGATYIRDVAPGELIIIDDNGIKSEFYTSDKGMALCGMEFIYIARPDSNIEGVNVHTSRKNAGIVLAKESPTAGAEVVIASPDTGISAAIGYAEAAGIPYEIGLIKNRYIGRTFIAPSQNLRKRGVKMKHSVVRSIVEGKSVILVDDSIVRGTTMRHLVKLLKDTGAREVHLKIASPLYKYPCYYGIDTPSPKELVAHKRSAREISKLMDADSISFISESGLADAIGITHNNTHGLCMACFNGDYPTHLQDFAGIELK
ncbi:MAG: amidophosphoribosyltransferase [Defluviitaleaceae bacterium]|nr:amidophosphoribosyltransferase [Defluviitaleaceae bacterium]MCL2263238.1 amidophosphoribosyltransferase [Defluviitaleaceae bacterium]